MIKVNAEDKKLLHPIRLYFTRLDKNRVKFLKSEDLKKIELELKIYLLLKGQLVIAASDLFTEHGYFFFKNKEFLLKEGFVVPALRDKFSDLNDFVKEKYPTGFIYKDFFEDNVRLVLSWSLEENSSWFRNTLLDKINDNNSLLNRNLKLDETQKKKLIEAIHIYDYREKGFPFYSFSLIENAKKILDPDKYEYFYNFSRYIYYLSGARVVGGESLIPQRNLIDVPIEDFGLYKKFNRNQILEVSAIDIFINIFIELLIQSIYIDLKSILNKDFLLSLGDEDFKLLVLSIRQAIGKDLKNLKEEIRKFSIRFYLENLGNISFQDIVQIRKKLGDDYINKFFDVEKKSIDSLNISDKENYFLSLNEIYSLREKIKKNLKNTLDKEFKNLIDKQRILNNVNTVNKEKTILGTVINFIPVDDPLISVGLSGLSLLTDKSLDIVTNTLSNKRDLHPKVYKFIEKYLLQLNDNELLDMFKLLYKESLLW